MSHVGGCVTRGLKDGSKVMVEVGGELTPAQWDELLAKLKELANRYPTLKIQVHEPKKAS